MKYEEKSWLVFYFLWEKRECVSKRRFFFRALGPIAELAFFLESKNLLLYETQTTVAEMRAAAVASTFALAGAACSPEQVFINYGNTPDEIMISFATSVAGPSTVKYGFSPSALTLSAAAQQVQYNWTYPTETPDYSSPFLNHALLSGLEVGGIQYFYTVGGGTLEWALTFHLLLR